VEVQWTPLDFLLFEYSTTNSSELHWNSTGVHWSPLEKHWNKSPVENGGIQWTSTGKALESVGHRKDLEVRYMKQ